MIGLVTTDQLNNLKEELIREIKNVYESHSALPIVYKSKDVKKLLGCSDSKLERLRNVQLLPFTQVLGTYYYTVDDVMSLFNREK